MPAASPGTAPRSRSTCPSAAPPSTTSWLWRTPSARRSPRSPPTRGPRRSTPTSIPSRAQTCPTPLRPGRVMRHLLAALMVALMLGSLLTQSVGAQVSLTTLGIPYTQGFDTLPASGSATWTNNSHDSGLVPRAHGHRHDDRGQRRQQQRRQPVQLRHGHSHGSGPWLAGLRQRGDRQPVLGRAAAEQHRRHHHLASTSPTSASSGATAPAAAQTIAFSYLVGSPTVTGSLAEFQSAGVAVPALDFTSPITGGAAGALERQPGRQPRRR